MGRATPIWSPQQKLPSSLTLWNPTRNFCLFRQTELKYFFSHFSVHWGCSQNIKSSMSSLCISIIRATKNRHKMLMISWGILLMWTFSRSTKTKKHIKDSQCQIPHKNFSTKLFRSAICAELKVKMGLSILSFFWSVTSGIRKESREINAKFRRL